ncbi:MAG: transcriptional regulator [Halothiobacillaceae bacterium]|nr:MAG: transcriptional regulator [Halothiobacillaceae bacterium]
MTKVTDKKTGAYDWHPADIIAAIKKNGWTISALSRHQGYASPGTLRRAIERKWPKGEAIIAEAIGVKPEDIWPSRYQDQFKRPVALRNVKKRLEA